MPPLGRTEIDYGMQRVSKYNLSLGITSVTEASSVNDHARWLTLQHAQQSGHLQPRVSMMVSFNALSEFEEAGLHFGSGDERLRLGAVKIVLHQATGQLNPSPEELQEMTACAHDAGYQLAVHAVAEEEVETVIRAYEQIGAAGVTQRRHRIEHGSECPPRLLTRLRNLQPVMVTQPPFIYYSGDRYIATVAPERQPNLYRIRSWLDSRLTVAGSSDAPVVPSSPIDGIYAAVTRNTQESQRLLPTEAITVNQALRLYTSNAAYASFDESAKGSMSPGKLADIVILSANPFQTPPQQLRDIKVQVTILGGQVVWRA